ncbi:hypothetical protein LTR70_008066 [Exophiala xenobiotica]|uniref:Uncharacterized protein n=1 Tax=Lithohypha guttulata TaxID=1690604 RepID=A0ABR0K3M2_9EURO|nr:hypothetical protein LTR24_007183 [Lithohypha guttulata]KAK5312623.1 hypothetical protein LTR70_008066 [Exophiala xenobiotica]
MRRRRKTLRTLVSGKDEELTEACQKFRRAVDNEDRMLSRLSFDLLKQNKAEHAATQSAVDKLGVSSKQLEVNTTSLDQATRSVQSLLEGQKLAVERERIMNSLSQLTFSGKQQDVFAKHKDGTCAWVTAHDDFEQWMNGGTSGVLWCPGKPGTGKTVVTSFAVNFIHEHTQNNNAAIAYIYCDYKDPRTHSDVGLLSSIARQLVEQTKSLPVAATDFSEKQAGRKRAADVTEWVSLIRTICLFFDSRYLFVDALDECPEYHRESLINILSELSSSVAICITSHPNLALDSRFTNVRQIEITATRADIATYLEREIPRHPKLCRNIAKDPSLKSEVVDAIQKSANGMFLLVSAQLEYLGSQATVKQARAALSTLPIKISDYYAQVFRQIEDQGDSMRLLAKKAISYVHCARRPLTAAELIQAVATQVDDRDLDDTALPDRETLLDACLRLLHHNEATEIVALAHGTLNQYLIEQPRWLVPNLKVTFARLCLVNLMFEPFRGGPCSVLSDFKHKLNQYAFWKYACHNWSHHVSKHQTDPLIKDLVLSFLNEEHILTACVQTMYTVPLHADNWHDRYPRKFSKVHMTAQCGLQETFLQCASPSAIEQQDSAGMTPLLLAAKHGHLPIVQSSIDKGAKINASNTSGETALALAARNGHQQIVRLLLSCGADAHDEDTKGWTALDWAILHGNITPVRQLLTALGTCPLSDAKGRRALFLAAEEGHGQIVQALLDSSVDINTKDSEGSTALDWAVPAGQVTTAKALLENGADVSSKDNYGNTGLHWAIQHQKLTDLLLDFGAEIDAKNKKGQTALCWASQDGTIEVAECLLRQGADANLQDVDGFTPLHRAALRGRMDMVMLLLGEGADPDITSDMFWTPQHVAIVKNHRQIAQLLSSRTSEGQQLSSFMTKELENCDTASYFNTCIEEKAEASTVLTGLRAAIQENQFERMRMMLEKGADVNAHDIGGWTALMMTVWSGSLASMQLLLEKGADIQGAGFDKRTALHWAAGEGDDVAVQFLVKHSARVDVDAFGRSPAMLAAQNDKISTLEYLIINGANPKQADYHQRTLLHWVAKHGDLAMLRTLIDEGADVNATDRWGRTVLMWALENDGNKLLDYQRLAVVEFLLQSGANIAIQAQHDITALHLAAFVGSVALLQYLLDANAGLEAQARWCKIPTKWGDVLDTADIEDTKYNAVRMMLLQEKSRDTTNPRTKTGTTYCLTAQEVATRAGMFAAAHLLRSHRKPPS